LFPSRGPATSNDLSFLTFLGNSGLYLTIFARNRDTVVLVEGHELNILFYYIPQNITLVSSIVGDTVLETYPPQRLPSSPKDKPTPHGV